MDCQIVWNFRNHKLNEAIYHAEESTKRIMNAIQSYKCLEESIHIILKPETCFFSSYLMKKIEIIFTIWVYFPNKHLINSLKKYSFQL